MADRYWVGGTATWDATAGTKWATTSGGGGGAAVPTTADDVYLDAASGAVTVSIANGTTQTCRSLTCTGFTGTLNWGAGSVATLAIGDASGGALTLDAGMNVTSASLAHVLSFVSTSNNGGTGWPITTAGKSINTAINFAGAGGKWVLQDAYTTTGTTSLTAGTLDTNGQTVTATIMSTSGTTTRVLTLGASTLNLSSAGTAWGFSTITNLTLNANTSTINLTGAGPTFQGGGLTYNNVNFTGGSTSPVVGANTFNNFTWTGTAATSGVLQLNTSGQTVSGTFTVTGNSTVNRVLVASSVQGSSRTITAAAVSLTNVDFQDITGAGAATWSGTSLGNALGNSGITFTTPVTRYGVVAGNFSNTATWSTSSGGSGGASHPICHDTVILDGNSGAGTYTVNLTRPCADIICTGFTRTLSCSTTATFYGDITLGSGMTFSGTGGWVFQGRDSNHTITTAGITVTNDWEFNSFGGTYSLQDNYTNSRSVANTLFISGTGMVFDANDFDVTLTGAASEVQVSVGELKMGNGTWNIQATAAASFWTVIASTTITCEGSTINLSVASANTRTFAGGGKTYNNLTYTVAGSTGQLTITGNNTFNTLNFTDSTNARTLVLPASGSTTVTTLNCSGGSGRVITVNSSSASTATSIVKSSGTMSLDYVSLRDIWMSGGATFYVGNNSTNTSNNFGMYWFAQLTGTGAGFNPLSDITWTAAYWANDPTWTMPGDGLAVSSLRDGSGNSRTMTQASGTLQPTYTTYDSDVNNRATLTFDGSADYLANATGFTQAQPLTVIAIAKSTDPANQEPIICQSGQIFANFKGSTGDSYRMTAPSPVDYGTTDTAKHFARFYFNGASSAIQVDASTSGALNPSTNGFTGAIGLGANSHTTPTALFSGEIAFVGVYNGDITANASWNDFLGWVSEFYGIDGGYTATSNGDFLLMF